MNELTRLEKCELTRKQVRLRRFKEECPDVPVWIQERRFQEGVASGYGKAYRRLGKGDGAALAAGVSAGSIERARQV